MLLMLPLWIKKKRLELALSFRVGVMLLVAPYHHYIPSFHRRLHPDFFFF